MKVYNTTKGIVIHHKNKFYLHQYDWNTYINNDNVLHETQNLLPKLPSSSDFGLLIKDHLLPPIGNQEVWASGVTYYKSRSARMEESKEAGGADFYDRVYHAERPELFFKSTGSRVRGSGQPVRLRKDSNWNVPEPELTLVITSNGKIVGYTIGNDMSSRSIEGENPLYLPQAKTYRGSAALGPCVLLSETMLPKSTAIDLNISRNRSLVFSGATSLEQLKREPSQLVEFLFREMDFPDGCFLMTGTGIIPPDDFTLQAGDAISIHIDSIGVLQNTVA